MNAAQKQWITATVPVLRENGVLLTKHFYQRLFTHHPELKNLFNMGNQRSGKQQTALAMAVLAYAENIANPSVLASAVNHIGHKHVSLNISAQQYALVGMHLIESIKEVLGEAATPEIIDAWSTAYQQLAQMMSGHEADLYKKQGDQAHGWNGWRLFTIGKKVVESVEVISFHLYPADGGKVPSHVPGQYISLQLFLPELNLTQIRQYSISSAPNGLYYRISVKREKGKDISTDGLISNHLHDFVNKGDKVMITPPAGAFVLPSNINVPIMLLSGGVGLTPLFSMLKNLLDRNHEHPITWLHGCKNRLSHVFKDDIDQMRQHISFEKHIFYNESTEDDQKEGIIDGYVDINKIPSLTFYPNAHYYVCGPPIFIQKQYRDLIAKGINASQIFFEEFGPGTLQLN